jgi:hypothetical protein
MAGFAIAPALNDRRRLAGAYYPLTLDFSYLAYRRGRVIQQGTGVTVEMSRARIRVKPIAVSTPGTTDIKLSIAWPAVLDDGTRLQFVVQGKPSWNGSELVEVIILKHEFRTASKGPALVSQLAPDQPAPLTASGESKRM